MARRKSAELAAEALETLGGVMTPGMKAKLDGALGRCAQSWNVPPIRLYEMLVRGLELVGEAREFAKLIEQYVPDAPGKLREAAAMIEQTQADNKKKQKPWPSPPKPPGPAKPPGGV